MDFLSFFEKSVEFIAPQVVRYVHTSQYIGEFEMLILGSQIVISANFLLCCNVNLERIFGNFIILERISAEFGESWRDKW